MCGIAGYIQRPDAVDLNVIERMTLRIAHRGPDGEGYWRKPNQEWTVALGHRRLSIIDIAAGQQPMGNEDDSVQISYNGEVYNFALLRAKLLAQGHRFKTRSDTEVIIHHHEQHGPSGLIELDGMFAFAIWDQSNQSLLLARDRVGIKPLYYTSLPDGGIAFASELRALLQHPQVPNQIDPDGLASFFFCDYAHPPHTLIKNIFKLPPAHYLTWQNGTLAPPAAYWRPPAPRDNKRSTQLDPVELTKTVARTLEESIQSQLVSDVPVGVFLSGGIDSSLVAAYASKHMERRPKTFSIGFADPQFDESAYARVVAEHVGSEHLVQTFDEEALLAMLDSVLDCLDEPIADPSILPTFLLSRIASQHVKVVLSGDGGDELWAGYPTYKAHRYATIYQHVPEIIRRGLIAPALSLLSSSDGYQSFEWKAKRFTQRWDDEPSKRHLRWMSNTDLPELQTALRNCDHWPAGIVALLSRLNTDKSCSSDLLNSILSLDFQSYLPGSVLTKVDRASMANGLEVRPPMLANQFIDIAMTLPSTMKLNGNRTKFILRRIAATELPAKIVNRKKKGFAIPLARWLRGPLKCRIKMVVQSSPIWSIGLLNQITFAHWFVEHQERKVDRSKSLWALLILDHWYCKSVLNKTR